MAIVITGGGRGLGWEMADALLQAGHRVLVTGARESTELQEACDRWNEGLSQPRALSMVAASTG
jgi:NAD(P)-dependent dehydrogenase (short-subunit alcohol dehydrogenase family)